MKRALLGAVASLALGACVAGPGPLPRASNVVLPPAFRFAPDAGTQASLARLLPDDPAYRQLAGIALADAPDLQAALARIDAARADGAAARAERLPNLDGGASVSGRRSSAAELPDVPGIAIDRTTINYGADLTARWDADLFGRLRARQRAALARIDAAGADAAAVRLALEAEIAASVIDWRTLQRREARLREDLESAEKLAGLAGVRERAGIAPGLDRVQAEGSAASSRSRLAALASERARLVGRLVTLVARPAASVEQALGLSAPATADAPPPPPALPSTLLTSRPDVAAAGARLRAANEDVAAAAAERFPRVTLSGVLGLLSRGLGGLFDTDSARGSLGAELTAPLLDFGRIAARIDRAEAGTAEAFADYRRAVFTALGDAEAAYATVDAADRELAAARAEVAAQTRAARLSETRFRAGLSPFLDVLNARRLAIAAAERTAVLEGRARRARLALWQALGGGA